MGYWEDRLAETQAKLTEKTAKEIDKQLKKYYEKTMKRTIQDFEDTYSKILLARQEGRAATPADLYKLDKYWSAQAQLRHELQKLGDRQIWLMSKKFEENFFEIYHSIGLPGGRSFNQVDNSMVRQLINQIWCADGKSWSSRVWANVEKLGNMLNDQLVHCVVSGKKTSELKRLLQERFGVSYSAADMLARTELAQIQTTAARQRYLDAGVREVEVLADEDERRCEICGKLHMTRHPIGGKMPVPAHPRCRCCIVPVIEEDNEMEQLTIENW